MTHGYSRLQGYPTRSCLALRLSFYKFGPADEASETQTERCRDGSASRLEAGLRSGR